MFNKCFKSNEKMKLKYFSNLDIVDKECIRSIYLACDYRLENLFNQCKRIIK